MNRKAFCRAGFTLAELMVVIVVIGVLMALLLPTIIKARATARVAEAKSRLKVISMAIDQFQNDFGFYPPTGAAWDSVNGAAAGDAFGDYGYNEALVFYLCNKFTKGTGDAPSGANLSLRGHNKLVGLAPVTAGPYLDIKPKDLVDKDGDGFLEMVDPWDNAYMYIPSYDYAFADGTYNAGALEQLPDPPGPDPTVLPADTPPRNPHCQRFKFQLISIGEDGWTPGLDPTPSAQGYKYWDITLTGNPFPALPGDPPFNPALVGTDDVMTKPVIDTALGHTDGTADDINNWNQ